MVLRGGESGGRGALALDKDTGCEARDQAILKNLYKYTIGSVRIHKHLHKALILSGLCGVNYNRHMP